MDSDFPMPADLPTPAERVWAQFLAVLEILPPDARAAFLLHDVVGATFDEVAIALGVPLAACRAHVTLARQCAREHGRRLGPVHHDAFPQSPQPTEIIMKIVVIGGTGLIGSKVVERLRDAGHETVVGSPSSGIDVLSGEGLDAALAGAQVVVDLANSPAFDRETALRFFQTASRNLLAAGAKAGVRHHVALSVVGTQKLSGSGYFVGKAEQERLIRESGIPYTIIHSTQFFEFLPGIVKSGEQDGVIRLPTANVQPIASDDVADAVTRHALGAPVNGVVDIAGPERAPMSELAQRFLSGTKDPRTVIGDPHALYFGVELQENTLVPDGEAWHGPLGLAQWLERSAAKA